MVSLVRKVSRVAKRVPRRVASLVSSPRKQEDVSRIRNSWDRRWGDDDYHPRFEIEEADPSVRQAVEDGWFSQDMRALDIGCGAGHNAAWLSEHGFEAVGIDFSSQAVTRARAEFSAMPNLTFEVVDVIEPHGYVETFDALVDRGCVHGIDKRYHQNYLDNLDVWARPGSRFLLIWRNKDHSSEQVVSHARKMLEPSFTMVSADSVDIGGMYTDEPLPAMAMRFVRSE